MTDEQKDRISTLEAEIAEMRRRLDESDARQDEHVRRQDGWRPK